MCTTFPFSNKSEKFPFKTKNDGFWLMAPNI